jgi:hypothetical protein
MLAALHGEENPRMEIGILCGFCDFRHDCPAFCGEAVDIPQDVENMARRYAYLSESKGELEKELKYLKGEIIPYFGERFRGHTDNIAINVTTIGSSETVDSKLLQSGYPEVFMEVKKPRAGYTKLEVKEIKRPELKQAA